MDERTNLGDRRPTNRWLLAVAVGGLVVGLVAGPAAAGVLRPVVWPTPPPALGTDQPPEHTISVVGTGVVTLVPDEAKIRLGVLVERKTAKAARAAAADVMTKVIAALRKLGIADRDTATSVISLSPTYDYMTTGTPRLRGYQLQNMVTVTVRDLDVAGDVIDDSVAAGATSVDGIAFDIGDRTKAEAQAREAAAKDARARADTITGALGVRITGVASITESTAGPIWYGQNFAGAPSKDASTPVLAGTTDVTITLTVTFLLG